MRDTHWNCAARGDQLMRSLALGCVLVGLLVVGARAAGGGARPPAILSWRHQVLARERYEELAMEWEAYVKRHPRDAKAWVEWGHALRYSGKYIESHEKFERAYRVDSRNVAAIDAWMSVKLDAMDEGDDWESVHGELARARKLDPEFARTYYSLWRVALFQGDDREAEESLRRVVEIEDMPRPLFDYGRNMVVGAPENAIIITNGDNDTYPPLAYQTITGDRRDVSIVNISLLNTKGYVRHLQRKGVPIGLSDNEIGKLTHTKEKLISAQLQERIFENLKGAGWPRPLFYSVTVAEQNRVLPCRTVLEGILERIVEASADKKGSREIDLPKCRELFDTVYRLESLTDPLVDWERELSVAQIGTNYVHVLVEVGKSLVSDGSREEGGRHLYRAVSILGFHHRGEEASELIAWWEREAPKSPFLGRAKSLTSPGK